jgi:Na+-driven multidrug efflux pump
MANGVLIIAASLLGVAIILAVFITQTLSSDASTIMGAIFIVLMIAFMVGLLLVVANTEEGFQVSGSTSEWMLAALISPWLALSICLFANPELDTGRSDYIDINDEKRMSRL